MDHSFCFNIHAELSNKIESILQRLIELLTSGTAKFLFIIAVIGVGYGMLSSGHLDKQRGFSILLGVGIIYSSGYLAHQFGVGV